MLRHTHTHVLAVASVLTTTMMIVIVTKIITITCKYILLLIVLTTLAENWSMLQTTKPTLTFVVSESSKPLGPLRRIGSDVSDENIFGMHGPGGDCLFTFVSKCMLCFAVLL